MADENRLHRLAYSTIRADLSGTPLTVTCETWMVR